MYVTTSPFDVFTPPFDTCALRSIVLTVTGRCPTDKCTDKALNGVHSVKATASRQSDLDAIRALIQSKPGGFEVLDSTVKRHLGKWFERKGAVRSAERVLRKTSRASNEGWSGGSERLAISPPPSGYLNVGGAEDDANQHNIQPTDKTSTTGGAVADSEPHGVWRSSNRVLKGWPGDSGRLATSLPPTGYLNVGGVEDEKNQLTTDVPTVADADSLRLGQRCTVKGHGTGVVRFIGIIKTKPMLGVQIGVALNTRTGLNDGTTDGTRYFSCRAGHGVFSLSENVQPVDKLEDESFGFDI
jgi:hypothetical protein